MDQYFIEESTASHYFSTVWSVAEHFVATQEGTIKVDFFSINSENYVCQEHVTIVFFVRSTVNKTLVDWTL